MKKYISVFGILFLFFLIFPNSVKGATYYVSSSGSDSGSGDISSPFKTIQKSVNMASSGDTVYVRDGIYKESVVITKSGTSNARITYSAYSNESPVIDGTSMSSISNDGLVQIKDGVNYITFSGFTIKGSPGMGIANRGSNNIISNNKILMSHGSAIWHRFGANTIYRNNEVAFNVLMNAVSSSETNITCNTVASWWDAALNSQDSPGVIWENNYVHDNCGEGVVTHSGDKVIGNTFKDNWSINIYIDNGSGILIDKNFIYETEIAYIPIRSGYSYKKIAAGFAVADERSPCATFGNTFSNNVSVNIRYGLSFYPYTNCSGIKTTNIVNNTFVNYWDYGIRIPGASATNSGSSIANNVFYSTRGKAMILENPADFKILNNSWYFAGGNSMGQFQWGSTLYDFNQWNALSTRITGNTWTEPQFVNKLPSDPNQYTPNVFNLNYVPTPLPLKTIVPKSPTVAPTINKKNGDANGDNVVDGIDYVIWLKHYNQSVAGSLNGNFDLMGIVDNNDLKVWLGNYKL